LVLGFGVKSASREVSSRRICNPPPTRQTSRSRGQEDLCFVVEHPLSAAFQTAGGIREPVYISLDAHEGPAAFGDNEHPNGRDIDDQE
jgi:hypothetical protein